ncbi:hypothetical protein Pcinc_043504 [Petrolisthes cinctipes]|uniref:Uncharacterized protein n=1 Tax=Petrolisthes cinctipes TaxID=88211 RepID=A0AAE1BFT5_PETCI|nr:hypothetical protein Pcinc_043504 [Petrolisthes cinctipes]
MKLGEKSKERGKANGDDNPLTFSYSEVYPNSIISPFLGCLSDSQGFLSSKRKKAPHTSLHTSSTSHRLHIPPHTFPHIPLHTSHLTYHSTPHPPHIGSTYLFTPHIGSTYLFTPHPPHIGSTYLFTPHIGSTYLFTPHPPHIGSTYLFTPHIASSHLTPHIASSYFPSHTSSHLT